MTIPLTHRITRDPYVDWAIIVLVSALSAVLLVIVGVSAYLETDSTFHDTTGAAAAALRAPLNVKELSSVLNDIDSRAALRSNLIRGYSGPGDPSL